METSSIVESKKGSKLLCAAETQRVIFDPTSKSDQVTYLVFLKTGRWVKKYAVEWPSVTVPQTVQTKLLFHFLKPLENTAEVIIDQLIPAEPLQYS